MGVVTSNRHQGIELSLLRQVDIIVHGVHHITHSKVELTSFDVLHHVLCVGLVHVHGSHIVVGVQLAQIALQLQVADVTTVVVVALGVTMTHEGDNALGHSCLHVSLVVQGLGQRLGVALLSHQRGTHYDLTIETLHIFVAEVTITVVHEVLYIAVAHTTILLTRNHLQRLHHYLLIASKANGCEPVLGIVVVFRINVLTSTGVVDTNG